VGWAPKGGGEVWGGGKTVVWWGAGTVWDKEAAHGISTTGDDDGMGMGARRGAGAGYMGGEGTGTAITAGGSRRADRGCAGPRAGAVGGRGRVAVLEWIWVLLVAQGGVERGEGGVEVGIVVLVDVLVLVLLCGCWRGDVKDVVSVGVAVGGTRVGRSLVRGDVGRLDECGELVGKVDRLRVGWMVRGMRWELAEVVWEEGDGVGHEEVVVAVVVGGGLWGGGVCGGRELEAILSDERRICHRDKKEIIPSSPSNISRGLGPATSYLRLFISPHSPGPTSDNSNSTTLLPRIPPRTTTPTLPRLATIAAHMCWEPRVKPSMSAGSSDCTSTSARMPYEAPNLGPTNHRSIDRRGCTSDQDRYHLPVPPNTLRVQLAQKKT